MKGTLRFRGTLADPAQWETLEDRIVEVALEVDGYSHLWRSRSDGRVVRGSWLDIAPGTGALAVLVSPEGVFLPFDRLESAHRRPMRGRPWISVATDLGPPEGHVIAATFLRTLRAEFAPDLEIEDASGWGEGGVIELMEAWRARRLKRMAAIGAELGVQLPAAGLTRDEAQRLVRRVRRALVRPPEHPPVRLSGDDEADARTVGTEPEWDALHRDQRRKQERLGRALEERSSQGVELQDALQDALRSEGLIDLPEPRSEDPSAAGESGGEDAAPEVSAATVEELQEAAATLLDDSRAHPLLRRVRALTVRVMGLERSGSGVPGHPLGSLEWGVLELGGGAAQCFAGGTEEVESTPLGLRLVQLKRALRGGDFALGNLIAAHRAGVLPLEEGRALRDELVALRTGLRRELARLREHMRPEA